MSARRALTLSVLTGILAAAATAPQPARAASAQVAALQVALRAVGLSPGPVDGITGPRTQAATRRFQARHHLAADGIAGPRTRRALGRRGRPSLGSRPLRSGHRGWDVAALQFLLHSRGYGPGGFDGGFGPNTSAAVVRFQRAAGLATDGVAGQATLAALRTRRLAASTPSSGAPSGPVRFLRPVPGGIGDGFGFVGGRRHTGIDLPVGFGTPIGAGGVGTVGYAGWNSGGYGNLVVIRHRLGFESWYAHLSRIAVSVGQPVAGGTVIGWVGSTGRSTGPHLHFEVRRFGTPIDPVPYLLSAVSARAAAAGPGGAPDRGAERADDRRTGGARPLVCPPNADARPTRDTDPPFARIDRCPG
ncbi:peptidoglycan-binding protein [Conexibacter arvalis]|uniref:Peptidoglycan hydrolase-like protein with peptidoglycan-binding domain n=1 Tax=Conexibacter arvalis TaxID=912552 RepID=A0A840ILC1_9ACTN|nr:peptidoglycan-binding protein [Conexibacter arvalis]MBB4665135.1 peptidoglycan hydrolase-like protein with peptidoglycan-binding domain [Conexibacter arvalis]